MSENTIQHDSQKRRRRKRRPFQIFIPVLFALVIIAGLLFLLFSRGNSRESIIVNPTDSQASLVVRGDMPEENAGSNTPQPSNTDNDWNLTFN